MLPGPGSLELGQPEQASTNFTTYQKPWSEDGRLLSCPCSASSSRVCAQAALQGRTAPAWLRPQNARLSHLS